MGTEEHRKRAFANLKAAVMTLSTTRSLAEDESGRWMAGELKALGHEVVSHEVLPDRREVIASALPSLIDRMAPHVILMNGGTGAGPADVTIEAVRPLFSKELTGFSALFAQLSYREIGAAAVLSRATAGVIGGTAVFCMPGSLKACKLACRELVFPDLGHLVAHIRKG